MADSRRKRGEKVARVPRADGAAAEQVVRHVARLVEEGNLTPGDQLPPERQLAEEVGVSRPTVRAGLRSLAAMGVVEARHGAGTFVTAGPPRLGTEPLSFLVALHGFTRDEMFEARRVLEVGATGLAAERALGERLAAMAEEVTGMFATLDDPPGFLVHDLAFHRAVAAASGNRVLAALVDMICSLVWQQRRPTVGRARDLRQSAEMHRRIYQAVRDKDVERARAEMAEHLNLARAAQAAEGEEAGALDGAASKAGPAGR